MKKKACLLLAILLLTGTLVGCSGNQEEAGVQKTKEKLRTEVKAEMEQEQKDENNDQEVELQKAQVLDLTLPVKEFIKKYPPVNVETEQSEYVAYETQLTYDDGLDVSIYHEEKDYNTGSIGFVRITSNKYYLPNLTIGMPLQKAYDYCNANFEHVYNHHADEDNEEMYMYEGLALLFNNRKAHDSQPVTAEDVVEEIQLYILLD